MGKKIYDEDLRLNLILNGQGLQSGSNKMVAELGKMEQEMVKMENKAKSLAASIKNLEKNSVANARQLAAERAELTALNTTMRAHQQSIEQMRQQVGLAGMTVQQLRNHLKALQVQLYNMPGSAGTAMFRNLQREIQQTQIRLTQLTTGASRMAQAWARMEQTINKAGTVVGWFALVIYGLVRIVSGVITRMKDLEDLIGNVRKNTGLLVGEVWEMKEAFDQWDTRTKTDDLLKLAAVMGKLGITGKEEIMKFVDAANMIQVALGDDLNGSVEDTVNSVGKLTNAFRVFDKINEQTGKNFTLDEAMLRTGDVLNDLAKSSAASAGTILEYMTRLAGVGELAGFTIAQIGGIGSVLDAMNVPSERGATALQKIMLQLANPKKVQDFGEALGLVGNASATVAEQYGEMLKNDPNAVLLGLMQKFVATKDGLIELTGGLAQFGVRGQYMTAVLGSMAQNIDVIIEQQAVAAQAWKDGTSVLNEYNIMNNNFTASVLKQQKIIRAQTDQMNRDAEPAVLALVTAWASFVVGIKATTDWIGRHWTAIKFLTLAYIALKAPAIWRISNLILETVWLEVGIKLEQLKIFWVKMSIMWTKTQNLTSQQTLLMTKFLSIANIAYTNGLRAAIVQMRLLNASMYMFPGIAMIATVAALAGAFYWLVIRKKELTEVEKRQLALHKDIQEGFVEEKANLDVNIDRLKDVNISNGERSKIMQTLKEQYGDYLPLLTQEGVTAAEVAGAYDKIVEAAGKKVIFEKTIAAGIVNRESFTKTTKDVNDMVALIKKLQGEMNIRNLAGDSHRKELDDDLMANYVDRLQNLKTKLNEINSEYNNLQNDMTAAAPPKKVVIAPSGKSTKDETYETFKQRQEALKDAFDAEELLIKQNGLKQKKTQDAINEELRQAKIRYLNSAITDRKKSWRTEDGEEKAYRDLENELVDLQLEGQKEAKKAGKKDEKEALLDLEKEYGKDQADIKNKFLKGEIETEDEYNDQLLKKELIFLAAKRDLYKVGSKEYVDAENELLSKKVEVEKNINDKIIAVQKQFAKIKTDRLVNEVQQAAVLENDRWEEEKKALESQLIQKKVLDDKEIEYNDLVHKIIEAKELEHTEKLRRIENIGTAELTR